MFIVQCSDGHTSADTERRRLCNAGQGGVQDGPRPARGRKIPFPAHLPRLAVVFVESRAPLLDILPHYPNK